VRDPVTVDAVDRVQADAFNSQPGSSDLMGVWCDRFGSCR
jgi:hypothetical protein